MSTDRSLMSLKEWALAYAEAGYAITPLVPNRKNPCVKNKESFTDPKAIDHYWGDGRNNIGLYMGVCGIFGLDADFKDGCAEDIEKRLPPTVNQKTPSGGRTFFFKMPPGGITNGLLVEKGLTVRATGYLFAIAPSYFIPTEEEIARGSREGQYEWMGRSIIDGEIAECPDWIIGLNTEEAAKMAKQKKEKKSSFVLPDEIPVGSRDPYLWRIALVCRHMGMNEEEIFSYLKTVNQTRCKEPKEEHILQQKARRAFDKITPGDKAAMIREITGQSKENELLAEHLEALTEAKKLDKILAIGRNILDCRAKVFQDAGGMWLYNIKNIEKRELEVCDNKEYLIKRLSENITEIEGLPKKRKFVTSVFNEWLLATDRLKEQPKSFCWEDEDCWTFRRLDFKPIVGKYAAWEEFLARLSAKEEFMAYVWSIFEMKNRSRQILYLHDPEGSTGKSTVIRVLGWVMGGSFAALSNAMATGNAAQWLGGHIFGKRLVAWADCKNPKFVMSEIARNISSGDPIVIERKGEHPFTAEMYAKLIIGSNHLPQITSGGADTSRLLVIDVAQRQLRDGGGAWEEALKKELPHFLHACQETYAKLCPDHLDIRLSAATKALVEDVSGGFEEQWEQIFARYFEEDKDGVVSIDDWMSVVKDQERLNSNQICDFKSYLSRIYKIRSRRVRVDEKKVTRYFGLKLKKQTAPSVLQKSFYSV